MSAASYLDSFHVDEPGHAGPEEVPDLGAAPSPVVVRRNAGLAALIGGAASAISIGYLWRASESSSLLDWATCGVLAAIAVLYLVGLLDARTPLLVADELGVRIRFGHQWRGLPWDAVETAMVRPRRGPWRDGRLMFAPHTLGRALEGLDARGRRAAAMNQKLYGAALAVPIGLGTRLSAHGQELADQLVALSGGHTEVLLVQPQRPAAGDDDEATAPPVDEASDPRGLAEPDLPEAAEDAGGGVPAGEPETADRPTAAEPAAEPTSEPTSEPAAHSAARWAIPLRQARRGLRADVTRQAAAVLDDAALADPELEDGLPQHDDRVRPIARLGDRLEPLVVDDFVTEPAYDPVIGPELAAARNRVGLSVDELAERTRIRPHVIESIEVDDFAPCGGDFYARGHLRTLARVLGRDPEPLLRQFDSRYATAPINARRVFEAELATGMTGSVRGSVGGPNWALLVAVVLVLVLVWGVVRLVSTQPQEQLQPPAPVLNSDTGARGAHGSGFGSPAATRSVKVTLTGGQAGSRVVVRDHAGKVVWAGRIAPGAHRTVHAAPPVRVRASNAGAIEAAVAGGKAEPIGALGRPGRRTLHVPPATAGP